MGSPKYNEVIVIRYTYVPKTSPTYYETVMKSQGYSSSGMVLPISDWYGRIIFRERYMLPPKAKILFSEWKVSLGDPEMFKVGNTQYDQVCLILGVELCYYAYFKTNMTERREEGTGVLGSPYCNCCINEKCLTILKAARKLNVNIK